MSPAPSLSIVIPAFDAAGTIRATLESVLTLGQPALRAFLLAEHTGCPLVPDMLRNSRTTKSNAVLRWLVWNMNYHAEHHAYPALPFHTLPKAHRLIRDKIAVRASGYISVHRDLVRRLFPDSA